MGVEISINATLTTILLDGKCHNDWLMWRHLTLSLTRTKNKYSSMKGGKAAKLGLISMLHVTVANPTWLKVRQLLQLFRVRVRVWYGTAICLSGTHTAHILKYSCRYSNSHTHTHCQWKLANKYFWRCSDCQQRQREREREPFYTLNKIKIMYVRIQEGVEELIKKNNIIKNMDN